MCIIEQKGPNTLNKKEGHVHSYVRVLLNCYIGSGYYTLLHKQKQCFKQITREPTATK